ncbi:MAG: Glutamate synthase large chain [Deltaproteobacteria bacterium]|nr:Glutamate synthase large chain [Deltaproteobacteria bacterium]
MLRASLFTISLGIVAGLAGCGGEDNYDIHCDANGKCDGSVPGIAEQRVFPKLTFSFPVQMVFSPADKTQAFVVEHSGKVRSFDVNEATTTTTVLDLAGKVKMNPPPHSEAGLNAIAFDPEFPTVPVMYVTYDAINPDDPNNDVRLRWRLSRFTSADGGKTFPSSSEQLLIEMDKTADEHNAGMIGFGKDGFLYVSVGDGGPSFDKNSFGQNNNSLYGKMLRIDVHSTSPDPTDLEKMNDAFRFRTDAGGGAVLIDHDTLVGGVRTLPYGIPTDNPFADGVGRPEIFATGLRNPWRWSFDSEGNIWAGDVGQDAFEEINQITIGGNYGWGPREARHCAPGRNPCEVEGAIEPVIELQHGANVNAVIGGYVYRGKSAPLLKGKYIFANFTPGAIFGIFSESGKLAPEVLGSVPHAISGFAEDPDGELYIMDLLKGGIYKLVSGPSHPAVGQAPPYKFLMRAGIGTEDGALAYYKSIIPGFDEKTLKVNGEVYTEAKWEQEVFGSAATVGAFYQNSLDLGLWRDMVCTKTIGRGVGGCRVRNWKDEAAKNDAQKGNLGTVTMDVSPEGFTRFYVFGPDGNLSTSAVLDSEGKKFIPELCTTCHGGKYAGAGSSPDLGSVFREWEPRSDLFATAPPVEGTQAPILIQESAVSRDQAQALWASLNDIAHAANTSLATEAQGAAHNTDHSVAEVNKYIEDIYSSRSPLVVREPNDPVLMPPSWAARPGESGALTAAKASVWVNLTSRYCAGCHRGTTLDLSDYANFQVLGSILGDESVLEHYIIDNPKDPTRATTLYMPQAKLMFERLQEDANTKSAVRDWANQASSPSVPVCEVTVELDNAAFTALGQDLWMTGNVDVLGNWTPAGGVQMNAVLVGGTFTGLWRGKFVVPQGMNIQIKATVLDQGNNLLQWEPDLPTESRNREFTVPQQSSVTLQGSWGQD